MFSVPPLYVSDLSETFLVSVSLISRSVAPQLQGANQGSMNEGKEKCVCVCYSFSVFFFFLNERPVPILFGY